MKIFFYKTFGNTYTHELFTIRSFEKRTVEWMIYTLSLVILLIHLKNERILFERDTDEWLY